ncbi:MAG: DNA polymerase I [Desulfovibrionaceae bacterium]
MSLKERLRLDKDPLFLIDGSAYIFRAFYAFQDMTRSDGFPTNAVYNVLRMLLKVIREEDPKYLGFFIDGRGPNFRHALFDQYKAQRSATPEALIQQIEPIRQGVELLGFRVVVSDGCEADDCIASLAARYKGERPVIIVGADKDLKQCLDERVYLWDAGGKVDKLTTRADFVAETGLTPGQWADFQAVIGDSADNIPGAPGIGPKTAAQIFADFPTLDAILENLDKLKPSHRAKIEPVVERLRVYRQLTTLDVARCEDVDLAGLARAKFDPRQALEFFREYEFRTLEREMPVTAPVAAPMAVAGSTQMSLFGNAAADVDPVQRRVADEPGKLPNWRGKALGLVLVEGGVALSAGDQEWLFRGPVDALPLAKADVVYCPSVKELLAASASPPPLDKLFDLGLAAYLRDPEEREYGWSKLVERIGPDLDAHPDNPGLMALDMGRALTQRLEAAGLAELMRRLEMPLIPVLAAMEQRGVAIDQQAFAAFLDEVQGDLAALTRKVHEVAGGPFNLRSSPQLAELLFKQLGLKPGGKTPGGAVSTSQAVLEKLAGQHPVIDDILEYRKLEKLRSTYLEPFPQLVDTAGRVHTTFNQMATATGRLSSSNPNLQNIPIRGPMGMRMRSCFMAGEGALLVAADYSQIELRVLAHMSKDPTLLDAFRNNEDIHARTAALLFDKESGAVTPDERRNAKTINFGLVYGMGPQKLSQELKISLKEAKEFIERYFERLAALKAFYERVEEQAKEQGYVTTLAGRRRLLPDIHSRNQQMQSQARRQAINTLIQGSAADIIKIAMLGVESDPDLKTLGAQLILQVHDELLLEVPDEGDAPHQAGKRLAAIMADVAPGNRRLSVPLLVDWGTGKTWDKAH